MDGRPVALPWATADAAESRRATERWWRGTDASRQMNLVTLSASHSARATFN